MKLTFWGTGTSTGVPMVGCLCAVCRSLDPRNRRRRASVLLENQGKRWLIDAGPDFRAQALDAEVTILDGVFLTHGHSDHILGLDDLRPLSWAQRIPVWADLPTTAVIQRAFPYFFFAGSGKSSQPKLDFQPLTAKVRVEVEGLSLLPLAIHHGDDLILGFRIGSLAYLTDCNGIPPETMEQLTGLDWLILDALRPRPHATHFSLSDAVAVAQKVGAKRTLFTHLSHEVDHQTWASELPPGMAPAYDGQVLEF